MLCQVKISKKVLKNAVLGKSNGMDGSYGRGEEDEKSMFFQKNTINGENNDKKRT